MAERGRCLANPLRLSALPCRGHPFDSTSLRCSAVEQSAISQETLVRADLPDRDQSTCAQKTRSFAVEPGGAETSRITRARGS